MENSTSTLDVQICPFFMKIDNEFFVFTSLFFLAIYFIGILTNVVIITMICLNSNLHTLMYLFLGNLSVLDICYTTVTIPKLLHILLSGNNQMAFTQCFTQFYFICVADTVEATILSIMAYDRYVAICHPLHYHRILNKQICILLIIVTWIAGCANSSLLTSSMLKMFFCSTVIIHQFFCDAKALTKNACRGSEMFYMLQYADSFIFGFLPFLCNLMSYVQIIRVILRIKSKEGRRKAFSTCSSHLIVMVLFYGSAVSVYAIPPSDRYDVLEQILCMFYNTMVPMLNPLIYSLRNKDVKSCFQKLLSKYS